jgi:hypothetical protein
MNPARFWWGWLTATVLTYVVIWVLMVSVDVDPRPERLLLLVALLTAVLALVNISVVSDPSDWDVHSVHPVTAPGQDVRLGMWVRVIGDHLNSRYTDAALRDRLAELAAARLRQRHGLDLRDQAATTLLGADVARILTDPARSLSRTEIETCVRRIEEL